MVRIDLVERNEVLAVAAQGHARGIDELHRAHGIAFYAQQTLLRDQAR
ncbi:hypothetical protein HK44_007260 [Pseudomonas fluorescens HK44]|uniref:Uncharacterized protein n=1 Tax=Pseudomonas fluorescens HK44 TaxID=1042209 RepID=A0A010T9U9_PSEFL|nr:hypothetical protein HK44_007260 [Pseudomonas fluorescens HK44]